MKSIKIIVHDKESYVILKFYLLEVINFYFLFH